MRSDRSTYSQTIGNQSLPIVIFISAVFWVLSYILLPPLADRIIQPSWLGRDLMDIVPIRTVNLAVSFILQLAIGYFLIVLNKTFAIIRVRASVQTSIYLMLIAICPPLHFFHTADIADMTLLLAIYFLMDSYQKPHAEGNLFSSFLLLGIGSVFFPKLTYVAPILWIGAYRFRALTFRSLFASIIGWFVPFWALFSIVYMTDHMELMHDFIHELANFHPIDWHQLHLWERGTLICCFTLYIISVIHTFAYGFQDKIRTRLYLHFLILLTAGLFLFCFLQPYYCRDIMSWLFFGVSIITGHTITLAGGRFGKIFYTSCILMAICLFAYNLWTL